MNSKLSRIAGTWRGSLRMFWRFPLRSALSILSAMIGVAGALSAVNYAYGGRQKVADQFAKLGINVLAVTPAASHSSGGRAKTGAPVTTLIEADYSSIRRQIPLFARSAAYVSQAFLVKAGDFSKNNCSVLGVEPEYFAIRQWSPSEGNVFDATAMRRGARVVVLGQTVARDLFGERSPIGERLRINRVPFEVIGVMSERGAGLDANEDDRIYVPLTTLNRRLTNLNYYSGILFAVGRRDQMDRAAREMKEVLRQRHDRFSRTQDDFQIQNQKQLLDAQTATADQLLSLVRWIAAGTLAVSGLGVLAISWMSVRERRPEIGVRRALGATRLDIFLQIVGEGAVLGAVGCALGAATAWASSAVLASWADQPRVYDGSTASRAIALAMALNLVFSSIAARAAAQLDPILALRSE